MPTWMIDELICSCIAREICDGDVLLEGIGAFMPTAAYELARRTHAPNVISVSPIGSVFRKKAVAMQLAHYEAATIAVGLRRFSYADMALWYLPAQLSRTRVQWKEFMRPAQVDRWGNTNNVVIGRYDSPTVRLPGAVGLPDGAALEHAVYMYLPRHDRTALVASVDFVSTVGHRSGDDVVNGRPEGPKSNPKYLVSDLGVFRFDPERGLVVRSIHPGVTIETLRAKTGCELEVPQHPEITEVPSSAEIALLREEIDPLGLRRLELLPRAARFRRLREILAASDRKTLPIDVQAR